MFHTTKFTYHLNQVAGLARIWKFNRRMSCALSLALDQDGPFNNLEFTPDNVEAVMRLLEKIQDTDNGNAGVWMVHNVSNKTSTGEEWMSAKDIEQKWERAIIEALH